MQQNRTSATLLQRLKARNFSTPTNTLISLTFGLVVLVVGWSVLKWGLFDAVFAAENRELCRAEGTGACWSVIEARWRLIFFGLYPYEEQWRSAIACIVIVAVVALSCVPFFWKFRRLAPLWVGGFTLFYVLMRGGYLGLTQVFEQQWGGLALTLFVFAAVSLIGMPMAIAFALLRRSELPWISGTMGLIIDTIRSLPLLSILFVFAIVLPFGMPDWLIGEKLYRVIFGFALFFACYQSEIIRGGMQAIPAGQEEAAMALGMTYWHRIGHIVLPQAFRYALPPTINQFVITFKETSLITIIGFFEVLASGNAAFGTAEWNFANVEVYVFVGMIFFVVVFSLSRYGAYLERRLAVTSR